MSEVGNQEGTDGGCGQPELISGGLAGYSSPSLEACPLAAPHPVPGVGRAWVWHWHPPGLGREGLPPVNTWRWLLWTPRDWWCREEGAARPSQRQGGTPKPSPRPLADIAVHGSPGCGADWGPRPHWGCSGASGPRLLLLLPLPTLPSCLCHEGCFPAGRVCVAEANTLGRARLLKAHFLPCQRWSLCRTRPSPPLGSSGCCRVPRAWPCGLTQTFI